MNLTSDNIERLTAKYQEFKNYREALSMFLISYISDYMRLRNAEPSQRKRYLRRKYGLYNPRINYQFNTGEGFCWSIRNIATVLGRDRSSISRALSHMSDSPVWRERISSLHSVIPSYDGGMIDVYGQDIFDVLIDYYEDRYLLRFVQPRRGRGEFAPDINELRSFWRELRSMEFIQKHVVLQGGGGGITFGGALLQEPSVFIDGAAKNFVDAPNRCRAAAKGSGDALTDVGDTPTRVDDTPQVFDGLPRDLGGAPKSFWRPELVSPTTRNGMLRKIIDALKRLINCI